MTHSHHGGPFGADVVGCSCLTENDRDYWLGRGWSPDGIERNDEEAIEMIERDERERVARDLLAEAREEAARIRDQEAQTIMEAAREVFGIGVERVSEGDPPPPPTEHRAERPEMKVGFHPFGDDPTIIPPPSWTGVLVVAMIFAAVLVVAAFS